MQSASLTDSFSRLVPWIRAQFPGIESLRDGTRRIFLDNAAGTLVPQSVAEAMADAALWANPQPGRPWPSGPATLDAHRRCRASLADFLNAGPEDYVFLSESTTSSLYKLREGLEPSWDPADNVVVSDCDHFANISPWEWRAGWQVRRAPMLPDGDLDLDAFRGLLDARTRLVALTLAGNASGAILPLEAAAALVRRHSPEALLVVDAVHAAPHLPIDVAALGADALAFSTYKLFGPNCGVLWLNPRAFARLTPYHVAPHTDPETLLEWGTLNNLWVSGVTACLAYVGSLGQRLEGSAVGALTGYPRERRRFKLALAAIRGYEAELSSLVLAGLKRLPGVRLLGPVNAGQRAPTFSLTLCDVAPEAAERALWEGYGVQAAAGNHYAGAVTRGWGLESVLRASFSHYNTPEEAQALLRGLESMVR